MAKLSWMSILWPSFLMASVLEMLVFAWIDPAELKSPLEPNAWSPQAIYSFTFFLFWIFTTASSALTAWLCSHSVDSTDQIN